MTVPPILNNPEPQFDMPEPRQPRVYLGWIVLAFIFIMMIGQQMSAYLERGRRPEGKYTQTFSQFQIAVKMRQASRAVGAPNSGDLNVAIEQVAQEVEKDAPNSEIAGRIYAAAQNELGKPIPDNVLAKLKSSKEPRDKFFAEVFGAKEITPERAKEIEKELKDSGFISKLATVVAYEKAGDTSRREQLVTPAQAYFRFGLLAVGGFAVLGGVILLLLLLVFKAQKQIPIVGFRLERMSLRDADLMALRCAQIFAVFMGGQIVAMVAIQIFGGLDKPVLKLGINLALVIAALALFRLPLGTRKFTLADIGIHRENLGKNILWGVATAMANLPLVFLAAFIGQKLFSWLPSPEHPATNEIASGAGALETFMIFCAASIIAPLIEEVMFRGTLAPALARVMKSPVLAILLQGLLFASIHPTGVPAWLALATIGAMSGFLYRQTGSLVSSIVMHAVHNFGTLLAAKAIFG